MKRASINYYIKVGLKIANLLRAKRRDFIVHYISVQLTNFASVFFQQLSGGTKHRTAVAGTISVDLKMSLLRLPLSLGYWVVGMFSKSAKDLIIDLLRPRQLNPPLIKSITQEAIECKDMYSSYYSCVYDGDKRVEYEFASTRHSKTS